MWGCLIFAYEALNWTMPNQIALNWNVQGQTKASMTISSCVGKRENRA